MPTIRLTPSTYERSNTSYVTVTNPNNMYTNVDSTTYAQLQNTRGSTSNTYYVYIRGFNFSDVPANAEVSSFSIKLRGYESYMSTSSSYRMSLYNGTTSISNTTVTSSFSTTNTTFTFPNGSLTWNTLKGYGSNFGIRVPLRRSSTSYNSYIYVYGAEIEVNYTIPNPISISSIIVSGNGTISPEGTVTRYEDDEYTLTITPDNPADEVKLERNGVDISSELDPHYSASSGSSVSAIPGSAVTTGFYRSGSAFYQSSSTSSDSWLRYAIGYSAESPYSTSNTSNTYVKDGTNNATTEGWMNYPFDFSSIPAGAEIIDVEVKVYGAAESTTQTARHADVELYSGSTLKSTRQEFTSTSNGIMTISDPGEWTRAELQNAQLRFIVGYYGGRILGATWTVTYTTASNPDYYTYSFTVGSQTPIVLEVTIGDEEPYIPEPEDPTKEYYSLTISSINADTDPENGTTRVEEGDDVVVTITPTDPLLTLALDNGIDITNQLVGHGISSNTYTVSGQVSGASYGFVLNNTTGYYTSNNQGHANSAAVARINCTFDVACLVTIEYINYAEATYDYGIFGQVDTALSTSNTADSGAYYTCNANSSNTPNVQTLTYNVSAGSHFIDIKYRKDTATDSNNDDLRWKVVSVIPTDAGNSYYTYNLNDVSEKHSLIFIFGHVNFYFINSSTTTGARIFPDGQLVKLEGDNYKLNIIPDATNATVAVTDNGNTVTSALTRTDTYDKNNNPIVNYTYSLTNITAAHNIVVSIGGAQIKLFVKQNGAWVQYLKAYRKINGAWVEQDITGVFNTNTAYRKGV